MMREEGAASFSPSPSGEGLGWGPPSQKELLARARELRRNPTEPEVRLWRHLSRKQVEAHKFRRQSVIGHYICDFFCPAKGLIVEVDGDTHDQPYDRRCDRFMESRGFRTLRFTNLEVMGNPDGVVAMIEAALSSRPDRWAGVPHPNPSPEGEGLRT